MTDNNDVFEGQGITFQTAKMASTAPSANPPSIPAPDVKLPPPQISASDLEAPIKNNGSIPSPPNPQAIATQMEGNGQSAALATAGAAPPQPSATSNIDPNDAFQQLGIRLPTPVVQNQAAFNTGTNVSQPQNPQQEQTAAYVQDQQQQYAQLAASRFTPDQQATFKNNPVGLIEAIKNLSDYPDVPALLDKQSSGQPLTQVEQNRLNDYIDHNVEVANRGMSWNGKNAFVAPQMPQAAVSYAQQGNDTTINQQTSPDQEGQPGNNAPPSILPQPYTPKYGETALNQFVAVTDKGKQFVTEGDIAPASTALKMFGYVAPDYAANPLNLQTPMVTAATSLPAPLRENLYDEYQLLNPQAQLSKVMTPSGWSKMIDTLGESKVGQIVQNYVTKAGNIASAAWQGTKDAYDTSEPPGLNPQQVHSLGLDQSPQGIGQFIKQLPASALSGGAALADIIFQKFPSALINGGISGAVQAAREAGMSETGSNMLERDLNGLVQSEMGRATGHTAEAGIKNLTVDHYLDALTPAKDAALVDAGVVSIEGGKSTATAATEGVMKSQGVPDAQAQETAANMSATEKDNYVRANMALPQSAYPDYGPIVYHGTTHDFADFQKMNEHDAGFFFTDNPEVANSYADKTVQKDGEVPNIRPSRLNMENPKVIDAQGANYDELPTQDGQTASIDYHAQLAKEEGHDGLVVKNVRDGLLDSNAPISNVYVAFDNKQIKSAYAPEIEAAQALKDEAPEVYQPKTVYLDTSEPPAPEEGILKGQTASQGKADPPPIADNQSGFNAVWRQMQSIGVALRDSYLKPMYAELFNDLQPIEDLAKTARSKGAEIPAGERSDLLTSFVRQTPEWIKRNQQVATTVWDRDGNQRITGKSAKAVYDDFDNAFQKTEPNMAVRHADFDKFLIAERFNEEAANAGKTGVRVTDEQRMQSAKDLHDLAEKYGDDFRFFGKFADELRQWDNRILQNLVASGLKSQEWYDKTVAARSKYSPLQRVVDEETGQKGISGRNGLAADVNANRIGALKQFKGSDKDVKNTLSSRLKSSALIMQKSASNQLRRSIAKYADYYPDQVKVSNPRIIKDEIAVDYDPKLRSKLEAAVEHFGGKTDRLDKIEGTPGMMVRGSYDPMQNLVRLRVGSTEGTYAHEVGHLLDEKLGLQDKLLKDPEIKEQLQKLAEDRLSSKVELDEGEDGNVAFREELGKHTKKYESYIKEDPEVIANMFDAYVRAPEQLEEVAPKAKAAFDKILDDNPDLAFIKDIKPSTERASEVIQKVQRDMVGPKNSVPFYENGQRKYLELSPEVYKAFNNMTPMQMGMVEKFLGGIFRKSTSILRFGATHYPAFLIRHAFRAVETSFLNTPGRNPLMFLKHAAVDIPKAIFAVMDAKEEYSRWKSSSGGFNTFMDLSDEGLAKMQKLMFEKGSLADMINPLHMMHVLQNVSDQAPRLAVFNKLKAAGKSDLEAGLASLEATGNYGRHGSFIKRVNQYAPFLNDMMQGGDRFVRSVAKDPAAFTIKAMATITMPQLIFTGYYLYAADDKTRDEYLNIPDWRKSTFMNIKIGDNWIPFPRAFAPGFVYGGLPEKIMIHMYNGYHPEAKNFYLNLLAQTLTSVSPVFDWTRAMPPIIKAQLENITNYSFFKDRALFAGDLAKTAPNMQFNQYTSETAKVLGKLFNYSPTDIDNMIYDMSAKLGQYSLQLSDYAINQVRKAEGVPVSEHNQRAVDNPIYGGLSEETPTGTNTESFTEFKEHLKDATQATNELKDLKGSDAAQFRQDNHQLLASYSRVEDADKKIYDTLKEIKQVYANPSIPADQKDVIIGAKNDAINRIAESVNKSFRASNGGQR